MDLGRMLQIKEEKGWSSVDIAMQSGVPLSTVYKILQGQTERPRKKNIEAMEIALGMREGKVETGKKAKKEVKPAPAPVVKTADADIKKQLIAQEIFVSLYNYVNSAKSGEVVLLAPFALQLDGGKKAAQKPDVAVVADLSQLKNDGISGAPAFVVEIAASPKEKDVKSSVENYKNAGVKEFWLVDTDAKKVTVHSFGSYLNIGSYSFTDSIPVKLFRGKCAVDLSKVSALIKKAF